MTNKPVVSIIIATYNRSNVLKYAIQSVLKQTLSNWELLVIGDKCTDNSSDIVNSFGDSRVHWFNLDKNSGSQSLPNNFGINHANGTYIAYLGHDDLWHSNHLKLAVDKLIKCDADLVYTFAILYRDIVGITGITRTGLYEKGIGLPAYSLVHKKQLIDNIGGWTPFDKLVVAPDQDLILKVFDAGKKIMCVPEITVFKFPASCRVNCYRDRYESEQIELWKRLNEEPNFLYRETLNILLANYNHNRTIYVKPDDEMQVKFKALCKKKGII